MDSYERLIETYLGMIRRDAEDITQLKIKIDTLEADMKTMEEEFRGRIRSLEREVGELKDELHTRARVYIQEMHGTVEGDAYQRKNS